MNLHKDVAAKVAIAIGLLLAAMVAPTAAQTPNPYPTHPVMLIVPYAAGGVADVGMRILGDKLSGRLKQQFVIENRPGAAGIVAAQAGATASPKPATPICRRNERRDERAPRSVVTVSRPCSCKPRAKTAPVRGLAIPRVFIGVFLIMGSYVSERINAGWLGP